MLSKIWRVYWTEVLLKIHLELEEDALIYIGSDYDLIVRFLKIGWFSIRRATAAVEILTAYTLKWCQMWKAYSTPRMAGTVMRWSFIWFYRLYLVKQLQKIWRKSHNQMVDGVRITFTVFRKVIEYIQKALIRTLNTIVFKSQTFEQPQ